MLFKKKRLAAAITVYWILLAYIVTGMTWWFIALETQNRKIAVYRQHELRTDDPSYRDKAAAILADRQKQTAAYIGEGSTFLGLILLGAIFVYREVRHQIRQQLQQQNFMMAVTHELKTPIAVTKLNLETLRKHKLEEQRQQRIIQAALQETERLDALASNILVASRLEGGGYVQSKEVLDLSDLARYSMQDLRHREPERRLEEKIEPGCMVMGDVLLLQLLISNLVENALKYSPREAPITLSLTRKGSHIVLSVADEGPGIPDDEKKKIFAKFYRAGQEETRRTRGTGLGLYLCRKIAEDHKATIKVTDHSPAGSIFTVTLKAA